MDTGSGVPRLEVRGLSKTFVSQVALSNLDLVIQPGEIRALVGENGSGKSTFIKILAGYHQPDANGQVLIDGQPLDFGSGSAAHAAGLRFVHQDLGLIDTSSVLDNLHLTTGFPLRYGTIRGRRAYADARTALGSAGIDVDPRSMVAELSPATRTGVAVARALRGSGGKLLVLDEPTATLPNVEVEKLLAIVRAVADRGVGVLYVSHRLDEVFSIADNVTVLRDGIVVAARSTASLTRSELVTLLVGNELEETATASRALNSEHGQVIFEVEGVSGPGLDGVSLAARAGDIIGVAGITGSGRETLLSALFGAVERCGVVRLCGETIPPNRPHLSMAAGVAFLPADRKRHGGFMTLSARENLTIVDVKPFWKKGLIRRRIERAEAMSYFERLSIRPRGGTERGLGLFSGGNQQKVLFGKWLRRQPAVLLLDEPTQGVDVGAKGEIHAAILNAAADGAVVIVSSSDGDELVAVCHRVFVMRSGQIVAELKGDLLSVPNLSRASLGIGEVSQ